MLSQTSPAEPLHSSPAPKPNQSRAALWCRTLLLATRATLKHDSEPNHLGHNAADFTGLILISSG